MLAMLGAWYPLMDLRSCGMHRTASRYSHWEAEVLCSGVGLSELTVSYLEHAIHVATHWMYVRPALS